MAVDTSGLLFAGEGVSLRDWRYQPGGSGRPSWGWCGHSEASGQHSDPGRPEHALVTFRRQFHEKTDTSGTPAAVQVVWGPLVEAEQMSLQEDGEPPAVPGVACLGEASPVVTERAGSNGRSSVSPLSLTCTVIVLLN